MEVFISWSGTRSERVAEALRGWLPGVIQSVNPFMSESDIDKGSRWVSELAIHLDNAQFGLICLTEENLRAPWLLFEAGALSKSLENARVVPYLYGFSQAQLQGPLAQFQASVANKSSTLDLMKSMNRASEGDGLDQPRLERAFETWWPELEKAFEDIPDALEETPPPRTDRDILEEILRLSRQGSRQSVPNLEIDPEVWRNLGISGSVTESIDPTENLDDGYLRRITDAVLQINELHRRQRQHEMRERIQRRRGERLAESRPSPESEVQSSNDIDNEP